MGKVFDMSICRGELWFVLRMVFVRKAERKCVIPWKVGLVLAVAAKEE